MGRWLALDIGKKRTGIAATDILKLIPSGLGYVETNQLLPFLQQYTSKEDVERIVVGYPKQADGSDSESMKYIRPVVEKIKKAYPSVPIYWADERYTTTIAQRSMIEGGVKKMKRREKGLADEIAAVIILRDYMDSNLPPMMKI
ncbi:MAG: Holliday junction resolvase RuvX [Porphyromonas sp.]|nr:Holliday junction resolvase RuvX [Porphyromonas sp.]